MFLVILCMADTMHSAANKMRGAADTMHGAADKICSVANTMSWCGQCNVCEVWWVGQNQSLTLPYGENKFVLNEYLGIFMYF